MQSVWSVKKAAMRAKMPVYASHIIEFIPFILSSLGLLWVVWVLQCMHSYCASTVLFLLVNPLCHTPRGFFNGT